MKIEKSAGAIIFNEDGTRKYLLLRYGVGHWDFPRGKIEKDESEMDAAVREIREETGLADIEFVNGFRETTNWIYSKGGSKIDKTAILFLAKLKSDEVKLSHEHSEFKWLPYGEAMKILTYNNPKILLEKADKFLNNRIGNFAKG